MSDVPKKPEELNLVQVKALTEFGHTDQFICKLFGIHIATWNAWKRKNENFNEALSNWKKVAIGRVEKSLFERAVGYDHEEEIIFSHKIKNTEYINKPGEAPIKVETENVRVTRASTIKHYPPDFQSAKFFLTNQAKEEWKDRVEQTIDVTTTLADAIKKARNRVADDEDFLK